MQAYTNGEDCTDTETSSLTSLDPLTRPNPGCSLVLGKELGLESWPVPVTVAAMLESSSSIK